MLLLISFALEELTEQLRTLRSCNTGCTASLGFIRHRRSTVGRYRNVTSGTSHIPSRVPELKKTIPPGLSPNNTTPRQHSSAHSIYYQRISSRVPSD